MIDDALKDRLSAYLDGELSAEDAAAVEALVADDPAVAAEFEALSRLDQQFVQAFDASLAERLPPGLAESLADPQPAAVAANSPHPPRFGWGAMAAGLALFVVGAGLGTQYARLTAPPVQVAQIGWLDQVADYHKVYAAQTRHLVEVPASDVTLAGWLAKSTGVEVTIPDLSAHGLKFEGGRLLVAAGKPVAQLMYTDADGQVVALCYVAGGDPTLREGLSEFRNRAFDGFEMVSWKDATAAYVVIGNASRADLDEIARETAVDL